MDVEVLLVSITEGRSLGGISLDGETETSRIFFIEHLDPPLCQHAIMFSDVSSW